MKLTLFASLDRNGCGAGFLNINVDKYFSRTLTVDKIGKRHPDQNYLLIGFVFYLYYDFFLRIISGKIEYELNVLQRSKFFRANTETFKLFLVKLQKISEGFDNR